MHGIGGCTVQKVTDFDLDNVSTFAPCYLLPGYTTYYSQTPHNADFNENALQNQYMRVVVFPYQLYPPSHRMVYILIALRV